MIQVTLPNHQYDVMIQRGMRQHIGVQVRRVWSLRQVMVITDENVAPFYLIETVKQLEAAGFTVATTVLHAGEITKSLRAVETVISRMVTAGFTRRDGVIALGGGVIGDLAGVVASLYMRGVAFIQIATSLTAQVDSSVGGKTAINLADVKNIMGTFHQPDLVIADPDYLQTLPTRDLVEGYAEVVKTSALAGGEFFVLTGEIKTSTDILSKAEELITKSVAYKSNIVMTDEREGGIRKFLNFGHTIGHAIELLAQGELRHGEAIAVGMVAITDRFIRDGITAPEVSEQLVDRLVAVGLPVFSATIGQPAFYEQVKHDKKNDGGVLQLVALRQIGEPIIVRKALAEMPEFIEGR